MTRYCKNCGSQLEDNAIFCDECGTKFGETKYTYAKDNPFKSYKIDMIHDEKIIKHSLIHKGCLYAPLTLIAIGLLYWITSMIVLAREFSYYNYYDPILYFYSFFNPFIIIGAIWFIIRYIGYTNNDLILTNKRVFGKCGLIFTNQMQSPINKIDSVSFSNGIIGKLIGYGTVIISTTSSVYRFRFIQEGQSLSNDIFNQLEISEAEKIEEQAEAIAQAISKNNK